MEMIYILGLLFHSVVLTCSQSVFLKRDSFNDSFCEHYAENIGKTMTLLRCSRKCEDEDTCAGFVFDLEKNCYKTAVILSEITGCTPKPGAQYFVKTYSVDTVPTTATTVNTITMPTASESSLTTIETPLVSQLSTTDTQGPQQITTTAAENPTTTIPVTGPIQITTTIVPSAPPTQAPSTAATPPTTGSPLANYYWSCETDSDCKSENLICLPQFYYMGALGPNICYCKFPLRFGATVGHCVSDCTVYSTFPSVSTFNRWVNKSSNSGNGSLLTFQSFTECLANVDHAYTGFNFGRSDPICLEKMEVIGTSVFSDSATTDYYARNCE